MYCSLLQQTAIHWLIDSGFAVQGRQDLLSVSFQAHEIFRSSGTVNSTGISRRGDRMAPYIPRPARRILQGQSGQSDHRAVVPMADCKQAWGHSCAQGQQNIPCVCVEGKMPSIVTPPSIPPGFLDPRVKDFARNRDRLFFCHYTMLCCLL